MVILTSMAMSKHGLLLSIIAKYGRLLEKKGELAINDNMNDLFLTIVFNPRCER